MRLHLLSESGTRPTAGQIFARNLSRLPEFMPQFWVFVILVMLSRNHQRMGDIFARTLVIRKAPARPPGDSAPPPSQEDHPGEKREPPAEDEDQPAPPDPDQTGQT